MIFINAKEQKMYRGDTFIFPLEIRLGNNLDYCLYNLEDSDEIYFAVMEPNCKWEEALIRKKFYGSSLKVIPQIVLPSEDTEYILPGTYYYQIKLRKSTGEVVTLLPRTFFRILE